MLGGGGERKPGYLGGDSKGMRKQKAAVGAPACVLCCRGTASSAHSQKGDPSGDGDSGPSTTPS